ncbi:SLBB domain-containing protein [Orrella sp. JC864]|uniref:SLBB domain-containing protein n=1 Tax=Orrella sp. JC864 TaxID=3120298 RepID=UPI00300ADC6C
MACSSARWIIVLGIVGMLAGTAMAAAQPVPPVHRFDATPVQSDGMETGGVVRSVGPGDTLGINVFGQPELGAQVTIDADGQITVPFLGVLTVQGLSPTAVGQLIADGLRSKGYLRDPQVGVEVVRVRSRIASILGEVNRPGRYPIEGRLTLLELLAMAGGLKDGAADTAVILRGQDDGPARQRIELFVGNRQQPARELQDLALQAGDIVYVSQAPHFFIHGEVTRSGSYPVEPELDVMRALSIAGGMTDRASARRITVNRKAPDGTMTKLKVGLGDPILPGDVIFVDERIF